MDLMDTNVLSPNFKLRLITIKLDFMRKSLLKKACAVAGRPVLTVTCIKQSPSLNGQCFVIPNIHFEQ